MVTECLRPRDFEHDLVRTATHADPQARDPDVYRIVWGSDEGYTLGGAYPKWMIFAQRVHEIRPVRKIDGAGVEIEYCEISTWECQKGVLAKVVRSKYGGYLQKVFQEWVDNLAAFCETMTGPVDRRDFSLSA